MANYKVGANRSDYNFFFDVELMDSLAIRIEELRSGAEYDEDEDAPGTALGYIRQIAHSFEGNVYLIMSSQEADLPSELRFKKAAIRQGKELRKLQGLDFEVQVDDGNTRVVSIIDLSQFDYDSSTDRILNWIFSLIVLTDLDINTLCNFSKEWISKDRKTVLPFNYDAIVKDLLNLSSTSVLRYFPADNRRHETIALLGNERFIEDSLDTCIGSIDRS